LIYTKYVTYRETEKSKDGNLLPLGEAGGDGATPLERRRDSSIN